MKARILLTTVLAIVVAGAGIAADQPDSAFKVLQQGEWTQAQIQQLKALASQNLENRLQEGLEAGKSPVPADTCPLATLEVSTLPFNASNSTVGMVDDYDLEVAVPSGCSLGGNSWTGTGVAPDMAYAIRTDATCTLDVGVIPTSTWDIALVIYTPQCSNSFADCVIVSDEGFPGDPESVTFTATGGTDYWIVIDGYSTGGTPPGPSGPFDLAITGTGCELVPVELRQFIIE